MVMDAFTKMKTVKELEKRTDKQYVNRVRLRTKIYSVKVLLNEDFMDKIRNCLRNSKGKTIEQVLKETKLSRGTVKTYLEALVDSREITKVDYNQNTKVYFWGKFPIAKLKGET